MYCSVPKEINGTCEKARDEILIIFNEVINSLSEQLKDLRAVIRDL